MLPAVLVLETKIMQVLNFVVINDHIVTVYQILTFLSDTKKNELHFQRVDFYGDQKHLVPHFAEWWWVTMET